MNYKGVMEGSLEMLCLPEECYKKFWFNLKDNGYLIYKEAKKGSSYGDVFDLVTYEATRDTSKGEEYFVLRGTQNTISLRAPDKLGREKWLKALKDARFMKTQWKASKSEDKMKESNTTKNADEDQNIPGSHVEIPKGDSVVDSDAKDYEESYTTKNIFEDQNIPTSNGNVEIPNSDSVVDSDTKGHEGCLGHNLQSKFMELKRPTVAAVAAIDFGTKYTGCAYASAQIFNGPPWKIEMVQMDGKEYSFRTPTVLLLTPEGRYDSFGKMAEKKYVTLAQKKEENKWFYFSLNIKMQLYSNKIQPDMEFREIGGKTMKALHVIAICIEHIKNIVIKRFEHPDEEIRWVLTVPAIWSEKARQLMIESAKRAGINKNNIALVLKPESAVVYAKYLEHDKEKTGEISTVNIFKDKAKFMVVNLGGGIVDVIVLETQTNGKHIELYNATGGPWGSCNINQKIISGITEIIGHRLMRKLRADHSAYQTLLHNIEKRMRCINRGDSLILTVPDYITEEEIQNEKFNDKVFIKPGQIVLSNELWQRYASYGLDQIIKHVDNILTKMENKGVSSILLAGGYSASKFVQEMFKNKFEHIGVTVKIVSERPDLIAMQGAVISGHMGSASIIERIARHNYGIVEPSKNVKSATFSCGKYQKYFTPLIKKGQKMKIGETVATCDIEQNPNSSLLSIDVYITDEEQPRQIVDDEHFTLIGSITCKLPCIEEQTALVLTISYEETEFTATITDKKREQSFDGVFSFLESK